MYSQPPFPFGGGSESSPHRRADDPNETRLRNAATGGLASLDTT